MNNAINLLKGDIYKHRVTLVLPNEDEEKKLYLILITAKTSALNDFGETYEDEITSTHWKLAEKVFGNTETENVYGVLVDDNLQMVFAFNRDFADYDKKKKLIVYKDIDDVLIDKIEIKKIENIPTERPEKEDLFPDRGRGGGGRGLIKYSLDEKTA